jgi:hypothetical protein
MEPTITLTYNENHKYQLEFSPFAFWADFSANYTGLSWDRSDNRLIIIAENYSYLLDLLVQARLFYLADKREDPHFQ